MTKITRIPDNLLLQYSELMQNCIHPVPDGSNISFKSKRISERKYWYLYISLGSSRREHYLGEDSTELLDRMDDERAVWASNKDDRELRARLVSMLVAGGMTATSRDEGKVLSLLERSGVFLAGGRSDWHTGIQSLCQYAWCEMAQRACHTRHRYRG